jgi:hypothetical protein
MRSSKRLRPTLAAHHRAGARPDRLTPGSIGRRHFEDITAEVNVAGKPDLRRIKDVMLRHDLVPA